MKCPPMTTLSYPPSERICATCFNYVGHHRCAVKNKFKGERDTCKHFTSAYPVEVEDFFETKGSTR